MKNPTNYRYLEGQVSFLNFMVALFCQPEDDKKYYEELLGNFKGACEVLLPDKAGLVDEMTSYVNEMSYEEILVSYTRIFLGPFKAIAHPYSSVYLGDGSLNGESTMWVKEYYNLSGFDFNKELKDLPDHIAVELEFMYNLKYLELESSRNDQPDEALKSKKKYDTFFNQHFRVWVPQLCKKVIQYGENVFYNHLCELLLAFIEWKQDLVEENNS